MSLLSGMWERGRGGEWIGVILKGVKLNSVSERERNEILWGLV